MPSRHCLPDNSCANKKIVLMKIEKKTNFFSDENETSIKINFPIPKVGFSFIYLGRKFEMHIFLKRITLEQT